VYLINYLSIQTAQQVFIAANRYRTGVNLVGPINGSNVVFYMPGGEKYTHNLPFISIQLYYNGQRLILLDDYLIFESGGSGTGYDTVILEVAPKPGDKVHADYII
jgi:hypothetical protein